MGHEVQSLDQLTREDLPGLMEAAEHFQKKHDYLQALGHYLMAIHVAPDDIRAKRKFVELGFSFKPLQHNPFMENALLGCLRTEGLDCQPLVGMWAALFVYNPDFINIFPNGAFDEASFDEVKDDSVFSQPFLTEALGHFSVVASAEFEAFVTALRKKLLLGAMEIEPRAAAAAALASYCFRLEYIFEVTEAETAALSTLQGKIASGTGDAGDIAVFCCYKKFSSLANAHALVEDFSNDGCLKVIVDEQYIRWRKMREMRGMIKALTPIEDSVSQEVRSQYEEFPYPLWRYPAEINIEPKVKNNLPSRNLKVLVAGCGTGHEAAMYSVAFPDARIMAVDLSLSSLSYGKMRTEELGFRNIEFWQGDILKLGILEEKFDIVSCGGVLHHMKDPIAGWRVLKDLVKDSGFMRIALYSKIARADILKAQAFIRENGYTFDAEGIRAFRRDAPRVLDNKVLKHLRGTADYYSMSMCRDLLFHVQEHDLDIPQIEAALTNLGLEFIGFSNMAPVIGEYKKAFPGDPSARSLVKWNVFERKHPDMFAEMYQFWCRKL